MKVGLTGGIGSGKSFVARHFLALGIPVYFADKEAKRLMNKDTNLKQAIKDLLGTEAYHTNGWLNRAYVAKQIFENRSHLKAINGLVHPAVKEDFLLWANQQASSYVLEESAILFENGLDASFDKIIVVTAPEELRISRVIKRDSVTEKQVMARMKQQLPDKKKVALANFVINNDGESDLQKQIDSIHKSLIEISNSK